MKKVFVFLLFLIFLFCPIFVLATDKVEINTASLEQLETLTGIGPVKAQAIIDARPFSCVDDLIRAKGIGEKTLQKIKDQGLAYVGSGAGEIASPSSVDSARNDDAINPSLRETPQGDEAIPSMPAIVYPTGVILNEVLPSPEGPDEENEWIELYNSNNFEVDLSGWKIKDIEGATTNYTIDKNIPLGAQAKISAYGYLIFKRPYTKITLNNTTDGLTLYWPNEKIIDSMAYEKAPKNQSYNKIGASWQWSTSLTPGSKNIIAQNNNTQKSGGLLKSEKSGNSNKVDGGLAAISQSMNQEKIKNTNPWFLFLVALAITIFSAIIVLFIKFKFQKHVRT